MLILRIRQAECALADGRLDEAYQIAAANDIGRHRHGQRLIGRLGRAMVQRGRENLAGHRLQPAMADCDKAEKLAGNTTDVAELRKAICAAVAQDQQNQEKQGLRVAQARRQIDNGWLSVGGQILEEAPADDARAEVVRQELAAARLQTDDAVAKAERALAGGDIEEAIRIAQTSALARSKNGQAGELVRTIRTQAIERIRADFDQGRIDRASLVLQRLVPLGKDGAEVAELGEALARCRQAAEHVAVGDPGAALPLLRKVKAVCPSARWLDSAISEVKRAAEAYDELDAGPLGLTVADAILNVHCDDAGADAQRATGNNGDRRGPMHERAMPTPEGDLLPSKFAIQIDGVGSFLVYREARITIGPVSSPAHPTLGLMADSSTPVVVVERVDDDYFVRSQTPIEVNGQSATECLLNDGDRIALSPRCRLRFHRPNPASGTAVLTVSGARLNRPDVRQLVLMDRDILVGPYANNHIRTDQLDGPIALFMQNGRLLCRAQESILVDGRSFDPRVGLVADKRIEIGKLSMVVARLGE